MLKRSLLIIQDLRQRKAARRRRARWQRVRLTHFRLEDLISEYEVFRQALQVTSSELLVGLHRAVPCSLDLARTIYFCRRVPTGPNGLSRSLASAFGDFELKSLQYSPNFLSFNIAIMDVA